jgi:tetratricopeptide (TPR) repeat protein
MSPRKKPQPLPPPKEGENFAKFLRVLRASLGETQEIFAKRFHRVRTYITNYETGGERGSGFMEEVVKEFKEHEQRIRAAFEVTLTEVPESAHKRKKTTIQRHIEDLIKIGDFTVARTALKRALKDPRDAQESYWLYDRLATVALALRRWDEVHGALASAVDCAVSNNLRDGEIASRNRLAKFHQRRVEFPQALTVLEDGLRRHPDAAELWLRRGYVHWYEQSYSAAYTSLTTAMAHGSARLTVLFARGQVLAEWGNYDHALSELEEYLAAPNRKPVNVGEMRHTRGYIWAHIGHLAQAFAEFAEVERIKPRSPWLHYRWGLCHHLAGEKEAAADRLIRSLRCENPWLKPPRRDHALAMLQGYGVKADIPEWTASTGY